MEGNKEGSGDTKQNRVGPSFQFFRDFSIHWVNEKLNCAKHIV